MRTLYDGIHSRILNNGHLSDTIKIKSGFHQGCVLSPGNFVIALQPLILKIKQANDVEGIQLSDELMKMFGLFADDIWATIVATQNNLNNLLRHFNFFFQASELEINYNKTQIMRIGSMRNSEAQFYTLKPLQWVDGVSILGVKLGNQNLIKANFEGIAKRLKEITTPWSKRSLNLLGKITICNSLLLSIPVYTLMMVAVPSNQFFREIKTVVSDFLWEGKPPRIRYKKLIKSKWQGGLSLMDTETKNIALKASWVPRLIKNYNETWAFLAYKKLPIQNELIWDCNISPQKINQLFSENEFWIQVWYSWAKLKGPDNPNTMEEILSQVLWYNDKILRAGKPWYSISMSEAGINRIQDLYDEISSRFLTHQQICDRFNTQINIMEFNSERASHPTGISQFIKP